MSTYEMRDTLASAGLQAFHFSTAPSLLPIRADVLDVLLRGNRKERNHSGALSGLQAIVEMPPVLCRWLRSGAVNFRADTWKKELS